MFGLEGCEGYMPSGLQRVLTKPNIPASTADASSICAAINGRRRSSAGSSFLGRPVPEGSIGVLSRNGDIVAVPPGRYVLGLRTEWRGTHSLTFTEPIQEGNLTIVRVPQGQLGLATLAGDPLILAAGLHVYNNILFSFGKLVSVNSAHVQHSTLHVLRVRQGEYAKVWALGPSEAVEPRLLTEGCYVVNSSFFSLEDRCLVSDTYVSHGSLHILRVPKGCVAKVTEDNVPKLLDEGYHCVESTNFQFAGTASRSDPVILHGTIAVVRVDRGQVALAWEENQPLFLQEPGLYNFNSPTFKYVRHVSAAEKVIELGAKKIITVNSGEVAVSYERGELRILDPGQHEIDDASHTLEGFLSTQTQNVRLVSSEKGGDRDLLVCETKDLVKVGIRADVFYFIQQPDLAIRRVAQKKIKALVLKTSVAMITNTIRSKALNEIAESKPDAAASTEDLQQVLLRKLRGDFSDQYGIEIADLRIESFKIINDELASSISKQALTAAQTESQLANLAGQTEIATREQERLAAVRQIEAEAEAASLSTKTEAQNSALVSAAEARAKAAQVDKETDAQAEAAATMERSKAEAEAIRLRGQAEAEAFELRAAAEAKRAQLLAETPLGRQLSLLSVYADMAARSNEGVQKVVYSDMKSGNLGLLGLPSLQNLSRDLAMLEGVEPDGEQGEQGADDAEKLGTDGK